MATSDDIAVAVPDGSAFSSDDSQLGLTDSVFVSYEVLVACQCSRRGCRRDQEMQNLQQVIEELSAKNSA